MNRIDPKQVEEAVLNDAVASLSLYKLLELVDNDDEVYRLIMNIAGAVAVQARNDAKLIES